MTDTLTRKQVENHCDRLEKTQGMIGVMVAELWRKSDAALRAQLAALEQERSTNAKEIADLIRTAAGTQHECDLTEQRNAALTEALKRIEIVTGLCSGNCREAWEIAKAHATQEEGKE